MGSVARFKRIYIEITNCCNLKCSFCQETLRSPRFMSVAEFEHIIFQIKDYTNYVYLHVKGEPLLHPNLKELLRICKNNNIKVNLTTNGTLLKKNLEILKLFPVGQINISVHSADDNDCIDIDTYFNELFYCSNELLAATKTEIIFRLWTTRKDPYLFGKKHLSIKDRLYIDVAAPFDWPDLNSCYSRADGFCQGLRTHLAILCDGTVVPCCLDGNGIMKLGNIFEASLGSILLEDKAQQFIRGFQNMKAVEPLCIHCSFKERFNKKLKNHGF